MSTMSISVDDKTKKDIDSLARRTRRSRSDVIRDMFVRYRLERKLTAMQRQATPLVEKLGLDSEDDVANYAKH